MEKLKNKISSGIKASFNYAAMGVSSAFTWIVLFAIFGVASICYGAFLVAGYGISLIILGAFLLLFMAVIARGATNG